jgi:hypothetical protein
MRYEIQVDDSNDIFQESRRDSYQLLIRVGPQFYPVNWYTGKTSPWFPTTFRRIDLPEVDMQLASAGLTAKDYRWKEI